jgi:hypothetical protein
MSVGFALVSALSAALEAGTRLDARAVVSRNFSERFLQQSAPPSPSPPLEQRRRRTAATREEHQRHLHVPQRPEVDPDEQPVSPSPSSFLDLEEPNLGERGSHRRRLTSCRCSSSYPYCRWSTIEPSYQT